VLPSAQTRASKIEAKYGQAERIQRFRSLVNHFIVHRPAKQRMRMTDNGRKWRPMPLRSRRRPQNSFEPAGRPFQKEIARIMGSSHRCALMSFDSFSV
jgi:hypothetical protein